MRVYKTGKEHHSYGKHLSEETKRKLSEGAKGHSFRGLRKLTPEIKEKIRQSNLGEKNPNWKGYDYQFKDLTALHKWIRRNFPAAEKCQICNIKPSYDLANVTGTYNRDMINWRWLCRHCHMSFDCRNGTRKPPPRPHKK